MDLALEMLPQLNALVNDSFNTRIILYIHRHKIKFVNMDRLTNVLNSPM